MIRRGSLLAEMRDALRPLAAIPFEAFTGNDKRSDDHILMAWNGVPITIGHVKMARDVIAKAEAGRGLKAEIDASVNVQERK